MGCPWKRRWQIERCTATPGYAELNPKIGMFVWCALVAATACQDEPTEPEPPPFVPVPTTIEVTPSRAILPLPGGTVQLTATVRDQNGDQIQDASVAWSSADPTVATVAATGLVTARSEGSTAISAQHDTLVASAGIGVSFEPDRHALIEFYRATGGPEWTENTNWLSGEPLSAWHGVWTEERGRVTRLLLGSNGLTGEIPPEIGDLSQLRVLALYDNALTGPVPSSFGELKNLYLLSLRDNSFTGPLPDEVGEATGLFQLRVSGNPLEGLLPERLTRFGLDLFHYRGTELCAPRSAAYQRWLRSIRILETQSCTESRHDRLVLIKLYEAMGGAAWTRQDGWLTDAEPGEWAGVSADDSGRVTGLDLKDNNVVGELPYELGYLRELTRLDLGDNEGLQGSLQEWMTDLDLDALHLGNTGACVPPLREIADWLDGMSAWSGETCEGASSILAEVPLVYLTHPVQNQAGSVPLLAGRDALLRVFTVADSVNYLDSEVRATFYRDGDEVYVANMTMGGRRGIPLEVDEGRLETSHYASIPGEVLVPGLEMVVELDPDENLSLRDGSQRRVPESGTLVLDVREMPEFKVTIVPVQVQGEDTTFATAVSGMTTESVAVKEMLKLLPVTDYDFSVRATFHVTASQRSNLLREVDLLRIADGDPGYYVGIIPAGGWALLGRRTNLSDTSATTMAHETGHNMSLLHAPCGSPDQVDPDFPHEGGRTGAWGYDREAGTLKNPASPDVLTYCVQHSDWNSDYHWISDYNHTKALEYRIDQEARVSARLVADRRKVSSLVLWGSTGGDEVVLDPAIVVNAVPSLPDGAGPYRIEGRSAGGEMLFLLRFEPTIEAESGDGHFVFTLPVEAAWAGSLASITLTGPNGSDRLDATTQRPIAIVTDRATGRIRKLLRDFNTVPVAGPGEVVTVSWGLPHDAALHGRR